MSSWRRTVVHLELGRHWTGGAQQVLLLAEGLQRKAVPTWLVCPKEAPLARRAQRCGLPVLSLPWRDEMNPLSWLRLGQWLRHLNPPPLLHLHSRRGLVGACVLARALRIPLVVHWRTITPMPPLGAAGRRRHHRHLRCRRSKGEGARRRPMESRGHSRCR